MMARILRPSTPITPLSVSKSLAWGTSALGSFYRPLRAMSLAALASGASSVAHAQLAAHTSHAPSPLIIGSAVPSFGIGGILQAILGLIVVIGIVLACGWLARRLGFQPSRQGGLIKVVGSASLGARERVVVVEVADTWLVLGVATGSVRRLHTMPAHHAADAHATAAALHGNADLDPDHASMQSDASPPSFQAAFARQLRARFGARKKE